jgi:hypothetical protein
MSPPLREERIQEEWEEHRRTFPGMPKDVMTLTELKTEEPILDKFK